MAPSQRIIFTALPAGPGSTGASGGQNLRLSVFVSPRLTDDTDPGTLDHFPDWMQWPSKGLAFNLSITDLGGNPIAGGPCVDVTAPAASQTRWDQLFAPPATVRVDAYRFAPPTGMLFHSYPAAAIHDYLRTAYTELARTAGGEYPSAVSLIGSPTGAPGLLTDIAFVREPNRGGLGPNEQATIDTILRALTASQGRDQANGNGALPAGTGLTPAQAFAQLLMFHHRPEKTGPPAAIPQPTLDFHKVVSSLGDHPYLLRLLGLVFDLEFDYPFGALGQFAPGRLSVNVAGAPFTPGFDTHLVYPETYFDANFRPYGGDASGGEVDLSSGDYSLIELDQDGGGLKLVEFASGLARAVGPGIATSDTPDAYTVPSVRTGGLSLARSGRASKLVSTLGAATVANTTAEGGGTPGPFNADQVTRGFRIDVWDASRTVWRQLCARSGSYTFLNAPALSQLVSVPAGDEGWVALGMTADPDSPADGYLGETLLLWNGWSLVATRPGKGLGKAPLDPASTNDAPPGSDFQLDVVYSATPGTLPPQRFGRVYAFRARAVDLAGNSLPFDEAFALTATTPTAFFGRMEPVISPALLLHDPDTEGESLERIVIRSNYNIADNTVPHTSRHVTPPITSVDLVERTGLIDGGTGAPDASKYGMLALRDGAKVAGGVTVTGENYDQPWYPVNHVTVPYLPDPLSRGAVFVGLPGGNAAVAWDRDGDVWPVTSAFRLEAVAGPTGTPPVAPVVNAADPRLIVTVPKAVQARVRFSSYLDPSDLEQFTLWNWLESLGLPAAEEGALRSLIAGGGHWMFTPWRELLLVHAVRQPLSKPVISGLTAPKQLAGDTYAPFEGHVAIDLASTGKLELKADWDEWIDAGATPNVPTAMRDTPVTLLLGTDDPMGDDVRLGLLGSGPSGANAAKQEFHDTRHRIVHYDAVATTRFSEFFVERKSVTMSGTGAHAVDVDGVVGGLEQVRSPDETVTYSRGVDYILNETAGTISRLAAGAIPNGQAVKVAYVSPPITRHSLEPPAPPDPRGFVVNVLSSARPTPPDIREIVPLFQWTTTAGASVHSRRRAAGFRVYLGRPWWSSGEGELLGVLMLPNHEVPGQALMPYVTVTAQDPAWNSPGVPFGPELTDFTLAAARTTSPLPLADAPSVVSVAGHRVSWDAGRKLWYCDVDIADLAGVRTGYFPFVRMALARWQPDSMPGLELSPAVQAEFMQLAPDRLAAIVRVAGRPKRRRVTVSGLSYQPAGRTGAPQVTVEIERRRPGVPKGDTGWVSTGTIVVLRRKVVAGVTVWSGNVDLPAPPSSVDFRLVIREFETMPADVGVGQRLVYLETVEL